MKTKLALVYFGSLLVVCCVIAIILQLGLALEAPIAPDHNPPAVHEQVQAQSALESLRTNLQHPLSQLFVQLLVIIAAARILGATRILECWGDDVPDGNVTDFRRAVKATADETVVFSWIEWPDKPTRDAGMSKMMEMMKTDPRISPEKNPMPFDGARLIYGGFAPIVTLQR